MKDFLEVPIHWLPEWRLKPVIATATADVYSVGKSIWTCSEFSFPYFLHATGFSGGWAAWVCCMLTECILLDLRAKVPVRTVYQTQWQTMEAPLVRSASQHQLLRVNWVYDPQTELMVSSVLADHSCRCLSALCHKSSPRGSYEADNSLSDHVTHK